VNSSRKRVKNVAQLKALRSKLALSLDYIFGRGTSKRLDLNDVDFEISTRTGRPRYVLKKSDGEILFTFRANGSIAPTLIGAKSLLNERRMMKAGKDLGPRPRWTITVIDGVSELVSAGRTVFCKHVVRCDDSLRANEDVAILNERGELLAVGRSVVSGPLMKQFKRGAAVKVREGSNLSANDTATPNEHG